MKKLVFIGLLLLSSQIKAQEITNYLFDANNQLISDAIIARQIIQKKEGENGEIQLTYLTRDDKGWVQEPRYTDIRMLAEDRYEELQYEDSLLKHRDVIEVKEKQGSTYRIRELEDGRLIAEASVSNLFPRVYDGFRSRFYGDGTKVVELYLSNQKYDLVIQPTLTDRTLPNNKSNYPAWYPGGSNRFVSDVIRLAQVPDSLVDDSPKNPCFLQVTIDQAGHVQSFEFDGVADTLVTQRLGRAVLANPQTWFPASDGKQSKAYTYIFPFYIFRHGNSRGTYRRVISIDHLASGGAYEDVYLEADRMPEFRGGVSGLRKFIASELHYPVEAKKSRIQGKVDVSFVVDKQGFVQDVRIARGVHPLLDQESMRVVRQMQQWKPGIMNGRTVNVRYTVPINFVLL